MNGVINVLKPPGMTSHDVVNYIRRLTDIRKVGHTGTLDPGAAGVLPICVGKATRIAEYLTAEDKCYRAEITLGAATDTQDDLGQVERVYDASSLTEKDIINVLNDYIGEIEQIPPMVSAIKIKGKKLYELARAGQVVERKPRRVTIYSLKILCSEDWGTKSPRALLEIICSKGTYIRTLCHDLGHQLGVGAYMSFLLRTRSGCFNLKDSFTLEELEEYKKNKILDRALLTMDQVLTEILPVQVRENAVASVSSGNKLYSPGVVKMPENLKKQQIVRLQYEGRLLALAKVVLERESGAKRYIFQPFKVLV